MIKLRRRRLILFLALAVTAGCATNALRVEYAGVVATKGKAAAASARAFLDRVEAGRQDLDIDLVSSDPGCARQGMVSRVRAVSASGHAVGTTGWFCVPRGWRERSDDIILSRQPIGDKLKPTLALIDSLSSYSEALAQIVAEPSEDASSPINDAIATARAFQDLIVATGAVTSGPLTDDRVKAVSEFVTFLGELRREAGQVRELRELMTRHPNGAHSTIEALRDAVGDWESVRNAEDGTRTAVNDLLLNAIVNRRPPVTVAARRDALRANYDRRAAGEAGRLLAPALNDLLTALDEADANLRRVLVENPNLNARERRRVAELNRVRIVRALERVTALITAFRGI